MKAIITQYHPCTNSKGSRISASAEGGPRPWRVYIPFPHELDSERAHAKAALALCVKMGWKGELMGGGLPDGRGYAFVFASSDKHSPIPVGPYKTSKGV